MMPTDDITSRAESVKDQDTTATEKGNSELNKRFLAVEWHEEGEKYPAAIGVLSDSFGHDYVLHFELGQVYRESPISKFTSTNTIHRGNISNALTNNMMKLSSCYPVSSSLIPTLHHIKSNKTFYAFLVFTSGPPSWHPLNVAWLNANQPTPRRRAMAVTLYMAMTNLSAVPALYVFRGGDKLYYHYGFKLLFIMAALAIGGMAGMRFAYCWLNGGIELGMGMGETVDRGLGFGCEFGVQGLGLGRLLDGSSEGKVG
ncbi:hypothetical protein NHQ30_002918 [Ciborinia camelliae]|nr:hypothetical protein NHQ30_002918 [Ciborinia camelliae]